MYSFRKNTELLPKTDRICKISFSVFTCEEIKQIAVKKITTPLTFDPLGHPIPGGLYDKALGPINDKSDPCGTCLKYTSECPGHMGYIDLPLPVVNPIFHRLIGTVLKMSCLKCFTVQLPALVKHSISVQIKLLDRGMVAEALDLEKTIFVLAQKYESHETIPDEATESINYFDKLSKDVKDKTDTTSPNLTKNTEQLRQQFLNNLNKFLKPTKTCLFCREQRDRIKYQKNRVILSTKSDQIHDDGIVRENVMKYVNPDESRNFMREIWKNERDLLLILAPVLDHVKEMENPTDIFYFEILPVPPPHTRPANWVKGKVTEHSKTNAYRAVLQNSIILNTIIYVMKHEGEEMDEISVEAKAVYTSTKGESAVEKLSNIWEELQVNIDEILNKDTTKQNEFLGLKQVLEKKQGLLRMHMMGKRVNFSARSVITPDPNIKIDEVGIPDTFAKQLTYPTYVNSHNVEALRRMVMNGPEVHPGAVWVQLQSGKMIRLDPNNASQREGIAKQLLTPDEVKNQDYSIQKVVHRHLCNGDILLLNRQPSLHKPSVMAHKARILKKEKTFRLHYANCKAYNADFDGDEMNAHFPQTEKARSEAYSLLNVSNQYLVPKDGTPLSGLIQDHVISGVKLSIRGKFFSKMDYDHLVFQALYHRTRKIKLLRPAIIKPQQLWSGKQVLSTIIINLIPERKALISLKSKSKIKPKDWQNSPSRCWKAGGTMFDNELDMSESQVIVRQGELLTGVLDKSHYGATPYGLIHCIYELYGGACATEMLSSLTRLFTIFLQTEGFTLGVQDILTLHKANKKRRKIVKNLRKIGPEVMRKALDLPSDTPIDDIVEKHYVKLAESPNSTALIDRSYKSCLDPFTNYINTACLSEGLLSKFPDNNLQLMVISGAKGSTVNTMQMSCCLGQIELEGKRPPVMISGKTLPSFPEFEFSPRAGGFVEGRFLTGIQPQEFFFHCMAGREGLIDTAVKTSRSGYLQRCLVKSLEGVQVKPDLTVRDSDNTIIQFLYGGDGMDVGKAQFLYEKHLPFLHENMDAILDKEFLKAESKSERSRRVKKHTKQLKRWKEKHGSTLTKKRNNPFTLFTEFFQEHSDRVLTKDQLLQLWNESEEEVKESFLEQCKPCPDTLNSVFLPHSHFGSINERIEGLIEDYEGCKDKKEKKMFANMMKQKAMAALCDSGEAVGLLAAQSIGEPSTQMTLNTFHFAGRGEMNVTLGIPRLREILMMASKNIKTPSMVIPFLPIENLERESEILRKKFNRVTVSDVLKHVEVIVESDYENRVYKYTLKFVFLPYAQYKDDYCINPKYVIKHMKKKFFKKLFEVTREFTKQVEPLLKDTPKTLDKEVDEENDEGDKAGPEVDSSDEEPEDVEDARLERRYLQVHEDQEPEAEERDVSENEEEEEHKDATEKKTDEEDLEFMGKFKVDQESFNWCQLVFTVPWTDKGKMDLASTLKDIAAKSVIWEVPSIKKSITYMKDGILTLRTDGINIAEMSKYENILDLKKLYCNDIHKMIENCGLGAGMAAIIKEIEDVFSVYGIEIDPRHLMLISDFMTSKGSFEPMNRTGMQSSSSPFHQMSFESSLKFLADAVIGGKRDVLANPSSSLMTGSLCDVGTGGFDLLDPARD